MEGKIIKFGSETSGIIRGVEKAANAVKVTIGPSGKCVAIDQMTGPEITRDGATVAKSISFKDPDENMGAQLLKKTASLTEEQAGDGTSTSSILTKEFILGGQKACQTGSNINELKSGMLKAGKWITEYIKNKSTQINNDLDKIKKVATISANNDPEVGDLIVKCMEQVGIGGLITADMASGLDTVIEITTGMKIDRGWSSPQYENEPGSGIWVAENPYILVVGERLSSVNQVIGICQQVMNAGKPLLIVCDSIDDVVSTTLILNALQGRFSVCVVQGIDYGDGRKNVMNDIAVATGAKYICADNGISVIDSTINELGYASKVVVSRDSTVIYEGGGNVDEIKELADIINKRLEDPSISKYDKSKFEKRYANLTGGIGIIKAGGATQAEKVNRKATIEDAILASKSAILEGYVPGGGYVYFKASLEVKKDKAFWKSLKGDEVDGANIVFSSLPVVTKTICENAGLNGDVILAELKTKKEGIIFNAKTKKFGAAVDQGVLDSAKVLRVALANSISTASMVLLTDCTITDEPVENNNNNNPGLL